MRKLSLCLLSVFILCAFNGVAFAAKEKKGIIVAAFGSSVPEAIESIQKFAVSLAADYPESRIVVAFNSAQILNYLDYEPKIPSVTHAITTMADEGINEISVLALYVSAGANYYKLVNDVNALSQLYGSKVNIKVSLPLAGTEQDVFTLASYLIYSMPADIKPGDAVIYVARGAEGTGSVLYPAMNWALFLQGEKGSLHMVVNLEQDESIKNAMQIIKSNKRKNVWIIPLLVTYGKRASEDIFNTKDNSVSSRFHDAGLTVRPFKHGLVSNEAVANLWKAQLRKITN
ncbi:sirohydrochlorin cobaltochelatase [Desulfovibrio sp. OttesenSCG-928-F07]|nr:sirohydrochlorin cobaltochelatase [Desulfovibrio sp. OttesenSCG-928-F07]